MQSGSLRASGTPVEMAVGTALESGSSTTNYRQFIDPKAKWYKNRRLVVLNLWILLL